MTAPILPRYGGKLKPDGTVNFWFGEAEVTMFDRCGGVLYPPDCIGKDSQPIWLLLQLMNVAEKMTTRVGNVF